MSENAGRFRSVLFGGFHRQDVLDYVEKLNQEHREALEEQRAEQEAAINEAMAQRDEEIAELKRQIAALIPQAESWQKIKETAGDITVSAHARAQTTLEDADEQARTTLADANAQAETTIQAANQRAADTRAESVRWMQEVQDRCAAVQEALHQSVVTAEGELDAAKASFRKAESDLQGIQAALARLTGTIEGEPCEAEGEEAPAEQPTEKVVHGDGPCPKKARRSAPSWVD